MNIVAVTVDYIAGAFAYYVWRDVPAADRYLGRSSKGCIYQEIMGNTAYRPPAYEVGIVSIFSVIVNAFFVYLDKYRSVEIVLIVFHEIDIRKMDNG